MLYVQLRNEFKICRNALLQGLTVSNIAEGILSFSVVSQIHKQTENILKIQTWLSKKLLILQILLSIAAI